MKGVTMERIIKITYDDKAYPDIIRNIKNPPRQLYALGDISLLHTPCFAVVGTRRPTEYGKNTARKIGEKLAANGITVISGMAIGIDSCAHMGALDVGKTIAVLGGGVDIASTAANENLRRRIAKEGLLLSEYPPGYPPAKHTFPLRNRIISGLASGVIVVEAGIRSGSLITAELAAEQGRNVYALPGNITSMSSIGTNKLLRDGAIPISVIDELLWDMGIGTSEERAERIKLSGDEKIIFDAVSSGGGEVTADFVCMKTGMSAGKVNGILTVLEMKGIICTALGKIFIAN